MDLFCYVLLFNYRIIESVEAVAVGLLNNENFTEKTFINEGLALRAAKVCNK